MTDANTMIPVLIVGGGPVGLTAAALLAQAGVAPVLVERHPGTSIHPRARGLNVRTMEIYRGLGLEAPIREAGAALAASRYMLFVETLAGREIRRVADDELVETGDGLAQITPCDWCQCAQDALEPLLVQAARAAGATVQFGTELLAFTQDDDGVTATLLDSRSGDSRLVRAQYLIAADGAGSPVRQTLGVPVRGGGALEHFVNIYFRADLQALVAGREFGICFVENDQAPGLFLAVNNTDRWLFNSAYYPDQGQSADDYTPARCIELVRGAVGLADLDVEILSVLPWVATAQLAEEYQVGRVFLAGDAAHLMPPAGGFGLNTGVQDAHNLAWKLAAVLRGQAAPTLLTTYQAERQPVGRLIVDQAVADFTADTPDTPGRPGPPDNDWAGDGPPNGEWAGDGPPDSDWAGDGPPPGTPDMLAYVLGYHYQSAAILDATADPALLASGDLRGQPGTRLPHLWLDGPAGRISTLDLGAGRWVLLAGPDGAAWREAAQAAGQRIDLASYCIGAAGEWQPLDRDWSAATGLPPDGALLIRPDGFVAWRVEGAAKHPAATLGYMLDQLLGRTSG